MSQARFALSLRDYQEGVVSDTRQALAKHGNCLLVMPTGAGKTVCFSYMAHGAVNLGRSVLILCHREELIDQASDKLSSFGIRHGIIQGDRTAGIKEPVQVASVQTLVRRLEHYPAFDLIIVDEAHHAPAGTWETVISHYQAIAEERGKRMFLLGVTATPVRLDGKGLGKMFAAMVVGPTTKKLMDWGYLTRAMIYSPDNPVDIKRADFNSKEALAKKVGTHVVTGNAVDHYRRYGKGMPAIAFCCTVAHAKSVAEEFALAGFRATFIDGSMKADRKRIIADFRAGKYDVLTSCDTISEGTDIVGAGCAILLRPTQSLSLHIQQVGRVLRPVYASGFATDTAAQRLAAIEQGAKPYAVIIDMVGNVGRFDGDEFVLKHGGPDEEWVWSLDEDRPAMRRSEVEPAEAQVQVTQCKKCYAFYRPLNPKCPMCGTPRPAKERQTLVVTEGELRLRDEAAKRAEAEAKAKQAQTNKQINSAAFRCRSRLQMELVAEQYGKDKKWVDSMWPRVEAWVIEKMGREALQ